MAPAPGSGLWIFDCDNRNLWALDRLFNVLGDDAEPDPRDRVFQPADGSGTRSARPKKYRNNKDKSLGVIQSIGYAISVLNRGIRILLWACKQRCSIPLERLDEVPSILL